MKVWIGTVVVCAAGLFAGGLQAQDEPGAAAGEHPGSAEVTKHGRKLQALAEAHLKEVHGDRLERENAWPKLAAALEVMGEVSPDGARIDFGVLYSPEDREWRDPDGQRQRQASAAMKELEERGFFEAMEDIASSKHIVQPAEAGPIFEWEWLAYLSKTRDAARALAARMYQEAESGRLDEALVAFEGILALGRIKSRSPFMIRHLVGNAVVALACTRAKVDLPGRNVEPEQLREALAAIDRQQPVGPLSLVFQGERLMALETVEYVYNPEKRLEHPVLEEVQQNKGNEQLWEQERAFVEQNGQWLIESTSLPPWEMLKVLEDAEERIPDELPVASMVTPASRAAAQSHAGVLAQLDGVRQMIALELMRHDTGEYPEALEELTPRYLAELPPDPFTGEGFLYRRFEAGEDPHGRRYLLYSTGLDGVDNGGRVHERAAAVATHPEGAGFDLVINEPLDEGGGR